MHEMAIAQDMIREIEHQATAAGVARITAVTVEVGAQRLIVPEALQMAFAAVTEDTVAAGATLMITEIPTRARCRACGHAYSPDIDNYTCPACGAADCEFTAGDDIILKTLEGEES